MFKSTNSSIDKVVVVEDIPIRSNGWLLHMTLTPLMVHADILLIYSSESNKWGHFGFVRFFTFWRVCCFFVRQQHCDSFFMTTLWCILSLSLSLSLPPSLTLSFTFSHLLFLSETAIVKVLMIMDTALSNFFSLLVSHTICSVNLWQNPHSSDTNG